MLNIKTESINSTVYISAQHEKVDANIQCVEKIYIE